MSVFLRFMCPALFILRVQDMTVSFKNGALLARATTREPVSRL